MGPQAALLSGGTRLHLQHGPIDLIIGADEDRVLAFEAARGAFEGVLQGLVDQLPDLRSAATVDPDVARTQTARQMIAACAPYAALCFVTPMAAVAGSVAQTVLDAMVARSSPGRAYVNNGGDIALHLDADRAFVLGMAAHDGTALGQLRIAAAHPSRGIATSGRHGRSLSLGIADSVTVLAATGAQADVAATLIANAVDLPGHPAVTRRSAQDMRPDSDLGMREVVTGCGTLSPQDCARALDAGLARARDFAQRGLIHAAALFLQGDTRLLNPTSFSFTEKSLVDA